MKIDRQIRSILIELIRPTIAVIFAVFAVALTSSGINSTVQDIKQKRTIYATLERRVETVGQLQKDLDSVGATDAISKMQDAFPPSDNIIGFVTATESLASKTSVNQTLNFGTPAPAFTKGDDGTAV